MLGRTILCLALAATASSVSGFSIPNFGQLAVDKGLTLAGLNSIALLNSIANTKGTCNPGTIKFRQEWRTLSASQRKNFIAAVNCLTTKPSILPNGTAPGSFSVFDDFTYVHMQQTNLVHMSGDFLTWHRYFIHVYEQELQKCGYTGNLPYWEWGYDVDSPRDSPVFDGSDTSLGSDGAAIPHEGLVLTFPTGLSASFPPGTGGGCVNQGPFSNLALHLGPVVLPEYGTPNFTMNAHPELDNPRCLKRDLNPWIAKQWTSFRNTTELILQSATRVIDRVYWIWQMLDSQNRQNLYGTNTFLDFPPSANTTVEDLLDVSPIAPSVKIKDVMNTVGGPLCYVYI
ncbi:hypothetical protein OQA88_13255 [Cercophora sp. LCS_1]